MSYVTHADLGGQPNAERVAARGRRRAASMPTGSRARWRVTLAMGATGSWNIDMSRAARETLPDYARLSYYQIWIAALEKLLAERGLVAARRTGRRPRAASARAGGARAAGGRRGRGAGQGLADRARARHRAGPLPGRRPGAHAQRARGRTTPGCRAMPTASSASSKACTAPMSSPTPMRRAWANSRSGCTAWPSAARSCGARTPRRAPAWRSTPGKATWSRPHDQPLLLPGMPQDCGEPVFAEPWQAQAFAMALALHQRGLFTWSEWADALSTQIVGSAGRRRCRPGRHLLPALAGRAGDAGRRQGRQLGRRTGTLPRRLGPCGRPHAAWPADRAAARRLLSGLSAAWRRPRPWPSRVAALQAARARRAQPA